MIRLRAFGPALPRPSWIEAIRAGIGAGLGLVATDALLWTVTPTSGGLLAQPLLIAPFGASAFLIFAVPNSPLAQPWSVLVGNGLSALAALAVLQLPLAPVAIAALAVTIAVFVMAATRSLHPPAGAIALFTALSAPPTGWSFVVAPVLAGSLALIVTGLIWNRATGRAYPFRQGPPSPHGTADPLPERRHLPPPGALAELLSSLRLGANIGVEDLARLITAAEAEAASRPLAGLTAAHLMSRDLVTVTADATLPQLAASFRAHHFKTLPVTDHGRYLGLITEDALIGTSDPSLTAAQLQTAAQPALPSEPAAQLVHRLADGQQQAVPIVEAGQLIGLVTRSDLIALLARSIAS